MTDALYIVFWKDQPGQQVSTVVDESNAPVLRDMAYIDAQETLILVAPEQVFDALSLADGVRYAITVDLARETLGWDI